MGPTRDTPLAAADQDMALACPTDGECDACQ